VTKFWSRSVSGCGSIISIYRATRMHSADYAITRRLSVSLSVRLSDTRWYSVNTAEYILKIVLPSGSRTILVLLYQTIWQYSDGDPFNGGVECNGGYKKSRFLTNISLYLRNDAWKANMKPYTGFRMVPFPMTLSDP